MPPIGCDPASRTARAPGPDEMRLALVVFVDTAECPWLRVLRRGFRHCFAALADGEGWLICDPLKDRIVLARITPPAGFDLAAFYAGQGHRVLLGRIRPGSPRRRSALAPLTCVAVVKRLLGVHAPAVLTPWQLFRHLRHPGGGSYPAFAPVIAQGLTERL